MNQCPNCKAGPEMIEHNLQGSEDSYCRKCGWTWTPDRPETDWQGKVGVDKKKD